MDGPRNRKPFPATVFSFPLFPLLLVYRDIERKGADSTTLPSSSSTSHSSTRLSALPSTPHPLLSSFRCTISPSLFHSFLPSFSLSPSKAIVTGNRCTPSLSFYLYARCGQIILESLIIFSWHARGTPPPLFRRGHSPFGKNAGAESLSPIFPPALWTDYVNTSRCFLATCICSPFWILPGIFTIQRPAATIFFFLLLPANRRPTRSCQEYSRFLG